MPYISREIHTKRRYCTILLLPVVIISQP